MESQDGLYNLSAIPELVRHHLATILLLPWLLRTDSLPALLPFYNTHSKELKSAQRFSPTRFIPKAAQEILSQLRCLKALGIKRYTLGGTKKSMNWDALGVIAKTLGAIAVVASLVYLARQVKQGSSEVRCVLAGIAVGIICALWIGHAYTGLIETIGDPKKAAVFVHKDSWHYIEMAVAFSEGDWWRNYVTVRAHRQPLYPALLATAMWLGADLPIWLGLVNIFVGCVTIIAMFAIGQWCFGSRWVGVAAAAAYASSEFMLANVSTRLLTEPTYVACALVALAFAFRHLRRPRALYLSGAAAFAGLAYLARPNGLFLMASIATVVLAHDLWISRTTRTSGRTGAHAESGRVTRAVRRYVLMAAVFVAVTTVSWLPRLVYWGNPIYHNYLPNYLWVDTYEEGHVSGPPRFAPSDYFSSHGLTDVVARIGWGLRHVFYRVPKKYGLWLYGIALGGMVAGIAYDRRKSVTLGTIMLVSLAPLIWTAMPNPISRVHYGGLFPFLLIFIAILAAVARNALSASSWRAPSENRGSTP